MRTDVPGVSTSEFKGKAIVQIVLIAAVVLKQFGININIDEQTAFVIIAGMEALYTVGRSIVKAKKTTA